MVLEEIGLDKVSVKPEGIYVELKDGFLIKILKKVSKTDKPHRDKELCDKLGICFNNNVKASQTMVAWIRFNRAIPLSKLLIIKNISGLTWDKIKTNIMTLRSGFKGGRTILTFPLKLDKNLGSVVGHILGDGSIDKKYKQVFYSNSNKELLKEFSENMYKIFSINARIWMQKKPDFGRTKWDKRLKKIDELKGGRNGGLFYPSICGVLLNNILGNFAIGKDKKISEEIKGTNKEFKRNLIRAFYDDEGTVGEDNLRLFQDRKDVLENFGNFLREFEIFPGNVKGYLKNGKKRYYLDIHRKSNLIKFRDKIGFTSSKKMDKLRKISVIKNYKNSK